uniref:Uncharacterized protein n=1 Tax=Skeletonema marinoi TaxID=267567 RepID=A0A7S2LV98_9STRA|mmetsp:Transcript_30300/g.51534  ORF Transcript_30300/g.51534 Transcript_30300/m.51534 type:complete len:733 (+) Transcript_30300:269-2467(+)
MSTSRTSASSGFDPEEFRRQIAGSLSPAPSVSGGSVSSGSAARQPSPRPPSSGRSSLPRGVNTSGPTLSARAGVSSGGGLSGKFIKFPVKLVPADVCGGVVKSLQGDMMCISERCSVLRHQRVKVHGFPDEPTYCLGGSRSTVVHPSPVIKQYDCTPELEEMLESLDTMEVPEWTQLCDVTAEEMAKQKAATNKSRGVKVETEDPLKLHEFMPIPSRDKVDLDPSLLGTEEDDAGVEACRNILKFLESTDIALDYANVALEDTHDNQVRIANKLDYVCQLVLRIENVLGDREYLLKEFDNLANGMFNLLEEGVALGVELEDMGIKMEELENMLNMKLTIANEESAKALNQLKEEMESLNSSPAATDLSTVLDDAGRLLPDLEIGMVDGKIFTLSDIIRKVLKLEEDGKDMRGMIEAKGGVSIGTMTFASVDELGDLIRRELPSGVKAGVIRCFVDAILLFVHVDDPSTADQANYKKLNQDLTAKDCSLISQCHSSMCPQYTGTAKDYIPGKAIECFSSPACWEGDGLDGKQSSIAGDADKSAAKLKGLAESLLKDSPTLLSLALLMGDRSEKWHTKFHAHLASELKTLEKLKLPTDDIFLLFSDLFRLIVELFHAERTSVHAIDDDVDSVDRLTVLIWTTLKVHGLMQDFIDAKFKNHPIVQAAFVRFLTTKIGQNTAAALSANVKSLEKKFTAVDTKAELAAKKSKEAASTARSTADSLAALKTKNPQLNN